MLFLITGAHFKWFRLTLVLFLLNDRVPAFALIFLVRKSLNLDLLALFFSWLFKDSFLFVCFCILKLVNKQHSLGFRSRTQWFISYIWHPVLISKSDLLNARHPFNPSPSPHVLQHPSVCSLYLRICYGLPASVSVFILFFLPFPYIHVLFLKFHIWVKSDDICLFVTSLLHLV